MRPTLAPAGGDYQYNAGPEGVEVLEFRTAARFNMRLSGNSEAAWRRMAENAAPRTFGGSNEPANAHEPLKLL